MTLKKLHYYSAFIIVIFVGLHLFNHIFSILGADRHIEIMNTLRPFYRNIFIEIILLGAVFVQIFSGVKLFRNNLKTSNSFFDKLQVWSGLYLAIFFVIHLSAVMGGRILMHLDTNFYFGVAGLNTFPIYFFFVPYYGLAITSFFGHIASVHNKKCNRNILWMSPNAQSKAILFLGLSLIFLIFYGLTNHFNGVQIPEEYNALIGK